VRNSAGELADGLHPLDPAELFFGFPLLFGSDLNAAGEATGRISGFGAPQGETDQL